MIVLSLSVGYAQVQYPSVRVNLHNDLSERIANFSIEALYHTSKQLPEGENFIMSPFTVWTVLAAIAEGADDLTKTEIEHAIRLPTEDLKTRYSLKNITKWLKVNTDTVQLAKVNTMFVDKNNLPLVEYQQNMKYEYEMDVIILDFKESATKANALNRAISNVTHGLIQKVVEPEDFENTALVLTSALYFKGQWTVPFNTSSTAKMPFYNSQGQKIGDVNMMYNRYTYPFSNFRELQARVVELPYGKENRLSMLIMLPNPGVSVEDMFKNFQKYNLDSFFEELRVSKEEYSDDEIDCFIPRFKVESDIDMTNVLKNSFGIQEVFTTRAYLSHIARMPLHVSKIVHKARIEVTEDGTTAAGVTVAEFSNRIGIVQFQANRPFTYIIIEKVTNSIVFGGFYKTPSLY